MISQFDVSSVQKERLGVEEAAAYDRGYNEKRRPIAHEIWRGKRLLVNPEALDLSLIHI